MQKEYRWHPEKERVIRVVFETKGSRIFKSAMNKIRNDQDKGNRITTNVRAALDEHWGSIDFLNKSSTAKANRSVDRGASTYCGCSISTAFAHFVLASVVAYPDFGGHDSPSTTTSFPQVYSPYLPLPKA